MRYLLSIVALLMLLAAFAGCSSTSNSPIQPDNPANQPADTEILFSGSFDIDLETQTITKTNNRQSDFVYDITGFLPDKCPGGCFRIEIIGVVGTILEIELTLENPITIQVYDARVEYLNLFGKTVLNPDSYTDFLGTPITDVFPFTAFTKEDPERAFPVGPGGIDTEIMFLDFPPGAPSSVNYAITASLPDQVGEPYEISDMAQDGVLTPDGGIAIISCNVYDHQGFISGVFMDASPFIGAPLQLLPGADPNSFECELENTLGAPIGTYNQLIMALSPNPQHISTYNYVQIDVTEITEDIIYVDDSNTTGIEDGTQANPYDTIDEGLDAASAGWEVWVDDSGLDYDGPITLKSDVVLKSVNWDISDGTDMAAIYSTGGTPVVTGVDNGTIDGFKVYGGSSIGVKFANVDATILNCDVCEISDPGTPYGIYVLNSSGSFIENCNVYDIRTTTSYSDVYGIYLNNSPIVVRGNDIFEITSHDNYHNTHGLYATACIDDVINHLTVVQNRIYGIYTTGMFGGSYTYLYGMYITGCEGAEITNNLIYSVTGGNYRNAHGVQISGTNNATFVNNTIYNVKKNYYYGTAYGLKLSGCENLDTRNNIVCKVLRSGGFQYAYGINAPDTTVWEYSDIYETSNGQYSGGVTEGTGCVNGNPYFIDPGFDFHLAPGSVCIDSGDPAILDYDGSDSDMGCYGGPGGDW